MVMMICVTTNKSKVLAFTNVIKKMFNYNYSNI